MILNAKHHHVGLYKVGTGEDISTAAAPGMFDLKVSLPPRPPTRHMAQELT